MNLRDGWAVWTAVASLAASISDRPQDGSTVDGDVVGTDGDFIGFISIYPLVH